MPFFLPRRLIELEYLKTKNPSSEEEIKEAKPYRNDMDFAFFAVNFGYTRAQFNALTPREIAFLYKAYEDSFVSRSYQLYNACFTAFYNANRGKKRRALKLNMSASATLSVKITGDASSFEKAVNKAQQTCSNLQTRFGGIGKAAQSIGGKLSKFVTAPALAATTALAGMALSKGFTRLKAIDEAKAKLTGLGNSAEQVKEIMKNANASVKGTAYGLDEAATTAASAVAAGVKPGKELTRYLSLTADAAAASGASMADMGSIINKVQTSQHAYTEEINMLADRGLPIYQWLADECHTSADAVKDMASKGEISSDMFLKAIEKNIGGAAAIIGESSFTGALSNVQASIGRIGANFLDAGGEGGGFFSQIKPLLVDLKEALGSVEAISADLGVSFGKMFEPFANSASSALQQFTALDPAMQKSKLSSIALGGAFAASLGPGIKTAGKLAEKASGVLGSLKSRLSSVSAGIPKISAGFTKMGAATKKLGGLGGDRCFFNTWKRNCE